MAAIVMIEEKAPQDHPICLRCKRKLKNPKWRKLGYGRKCYALAHQGAGQAPAEALDLIPVAEAHAAAYHQIDGRQDRAPDPKINKSGKRAALDAAFQEEMVKKNPEPTAEQRRAAEKRLLQDVDQALGGEEDGEEGEIAEGPAENPAEEPTEEEVRRKKNKTPKGMAVVKPGAFNRKGRSMIVNGRDPKSED